MTGEPLNPGLGEAFWSARPVLIHIRQAAHARCRSAQAVLGVVLARVAMLTPPALRTPAIVGGRATLDLLVALIGASGAGKSSANDVGRELLPTDRIDIKDGFLLGSGEGIAEGFLGPPEKVEGDDGKKRVVRHQEFTAVLAVADEGQVLLELGQRKGSVLLPQLRSAWSGHTLGYRRTPRPRRGAGSNRGAIGSLPYSRCNRNTPPNCSPTPPGGLPQRFVFLNAVDPTIPDHAHDGRVLTAGRRQRR